MFKYYVYGWRSMSGWEKVMQEIESELLLSKQELIEKAKDYDSIETEVVDTDYDDYAEWIDDDQWEVFIHEEITGFVELKEDNNGENI